MKPKIKILHLEDRSSDAELIESALKKGKINPEILVVPDKAAFVKALKNFSYDIILSDHSLASFDSLEAIKLVKEAGITVPFLLVTATMTDIFAAKVMKEGACDYILKDRLHRLPSAIINSIEKHALQEKQQAANERLAFHIENTPLGFIEWDNQLHIKALSKQAEEIFGWNLDEFSEDEKNGYSHVYAEDLPIAIKAAEELVNAAVQRNTTQHRNITKNGRIIWCEWFNSVLLDKDGKVVTIMSLVQDITVQKEAEEKLNKANSLYAFISQLNQNIVIVKTEAMLFRNSCDIALKFGEFKMAWIGLFNNESQKISVAGQSGIPEEDMKLFDNAPCHINGPQDQVMRSGKYYICNDVARDLELETWKRFAAKQGIQSCMVLPIRKSGKIIGTLNLYSTKLNFFEKEEIAFLIEITGNISFALDLFEKEKDHKLTQDLVIKNEKLFRALIENNADMITLGNSAGELIYGSPSITAVLGYSADELINKSLFDVIHPDDLPELMGNRSKLLANPGKSFDFQHRRKHKNGRWIWCEGTFTNMLDEPGINAIVTNFRDISEKKIAEQQQAFDLNNLNALINNTNDLMWSVDKDFNLITSNLPFDNILKLTSGKIVEKGSKILDATYSDGQSEPYKKLYERAFTGEAFTEVVYNEPPVDSWSEISYYPIHNGDEIIGTACHSRDITAKIKGERKLIKSEIFNRGVLNSLSSHIAVIDSMGNIVAVNESWNRFGVENGETTLTRTGMGSNYFDVCEKSARSGEPIAAQALAGIKEVMNEKKAVYYLEYPCHSPTVQRWFGMRATKFESDEPMVVVAHHDISERKHAEKNLLESESRLKEAQAIARTGDFEVDLVNYTEVWSDEMYNISGISKAENSPSTALFLSIIYPDDVSFVQQGFSESLRTFKDTSFEFRFVRKDGTLRYGCTEGRFEFDKNQDPIRLFGIFQDITERKLAEMDRIKMVNDLMLRNKDLEQFAYIISHNLRAPVANIIGASNVLNDPEVSSEDKEMLSRGISISVMKLDDVVKDLNQILQVKDNINETREIVSFSGLVEDIKISIKDLVDKYGIEIRYDFSAINEFFTLKPYLYSIFYNLISNSIKYRRPHIHSIIEIKSRLVRGNLELVFIDNGMGIDLKKNGGDIFGLYKQFHTHIEGKGMGLFMVKTQVETLGGKIGIQSKPNEGTDFKIEFNL